MPKFTLDTLRGSNEVRCVATATPEIRAALGNIGLGETIPTGISPSIQAEQSSTSERLTGDDPLDVIKMTDIKAAFRENLAAAEIFYKKFHVTAPNIADLVTHGVDFDKLADVFFRAHTSDLKPELLLAAYGFDVTAWLANYKGTLNIAPVIKKNWDQLTNPPLGSFSHNQLQWTLRVIPGTLEPPTSARNATHSADNNDNNPTIPEYLTLQATRAEIGKQPLDTRYSSWLAGKFDGTVTVNAPCGHYNLDKQQLTIACDNIGNPIYNVGNRGVVQ